MENILVLGNGFIASHLNYNKTNYRIEPDKKYNIENLLNIHKPDVIINTIGFCGSPNIDQCETEKEKTYTINTIIPVMLANECEKHSVRFIHIGSGCVSYGLSPNARYNIASKNKIFEPGWKENDFANPLSYYSKTKYSADLLMSDLKNVCILRIRMPVSSKNHPRNLLNKLLSYKQIIDVENSITFLDDFIAAVDFIIQNNKTGIYNIASPIPLKHSDLLDEYNKYIPHIYEKIKPNELNTVATRSNCILDINKIQNEGFVFTDTYERMRATIKDYVENAK
jgi:dTDP-4-dehydrorhamnose reductase